MPSPTKKRKLNNGGNASAAPSKGLEYFFSKQKKNETAKTPSVELPNDEPALSDEELARKLQAEWDQEAAAAAPGRQNETPSSGNDEEAGKSDILGSGAGVKTEPLPEAEDSTQSLASHTKQPASKSTTLNLQSAGMAEDTVTAYIPFDESPLTFNPSTYAKQLRECWSADGGNASYALLTRCFVLINGTTSRIKIVDTLVNCLRVLIESDPASLLPAVSFTTPDHGNADRYRSGYLQMPYPRHTYPSSLV